MLTPLDSFRGSKIFFYVLNSEIVLSKTAMQITNIFQCLSNTGAIFTVLRDINFKGFFIRTNSVINTISFIVSISNTVVTKTTSG